jgi:hypothetical protein
MSDMPQRTARIACLVALALGLGACTSHGSKPDGGTSGGGSPAALTTFDGDGFSIGVPSAWSGCSIPAGGTEVPATDQFRPSTAAFAPIVDISNEEKTRTYAHATTFHELVLQITPHFKEVSKTSVKVPGATQAQRIEYTQESPYPTANGDFPKVHGISVVAEASDGVIYSMVVSASATDWAAMQATLVAVADSLRLGSAGGASSLPLCAGVTTPTASASATP